MQVSDATSCSGRTVGPATEVMVVASLMCLYRAHGLPVVDGGKLMGVLSSGDVHKASFHTNPSGKRSG